jgi:hypothetical protein
MITWGPARPKKAPTPGDVWAVLEEDDLLRAKAG